MSYLKDFIKRFNAPSLPVPGNVYDQRYFDKHNSILRLFFNEITNAVQGIIGVNGGRFINIPFGDFTDDTDQMAGSTTSAYRLRVSTTELANAVSLQSYTAGFVGTISNGSGSAGTVLNITTVNTGTIYLGMLVTGTGVTAGTHITAFGTGSGGIGTYTVSTSQLVSNTTLAGSLSSKIAVEHNGLYEVLVSIQFSNNDTNTQDVDVWFAKNGANIANSNNLFSVVGRHGSIDGRLIAVATFFVDLVAGDYVEVFWSVSDVKVFVEHVDAASSPTRPAVPSVILSIKHISNVL